MGWLHSIDDGSGIYLNKLSITEIYNNIEKLDIDLSDNTIKNITCLIQINKEVDISPVGY